MKNTLAPVIARIVLRYLSGGLISLGGAWAVIGATVRADAELHGLVAAGIGAGLGLLTEWAYARARASGGPT